LVATSEHGAPPDVDIDAEAVLEQELEHEQEPEPEPELQVEIEPEIEPEAEPETESDRESESESRPERGPELEPDSEPAVRYADFTERVYDTAAGFSNPPGLRTHGGPTVADMSPKVSIATTLPLALLDETLVDLSASGVRVAAALETEPVDVGWPLSVAAERRFELPLPDQRFHDSAGAVRTLHAALPGESSVDALDRLELVRLVGLGLMALHAAELVTGGVTLDAYAFSVDPRPSLCLLRPDQLRRIGGEQLVSDAATWGRQFDEDRFEFAVLAHRMLISGHSQAGIHDLEDVQIAGIRPSQHQRLAQLWARASQEPGTRPQVAEWMEVLVP
jgi:hypothetical protein